MVKRTILFGSFSCLILLSFCSVLAVTDDNQDQQVYIVYMGALPSSEVYAPMSDHMNILQKITGESSNEDRLVRSYKRSFNGFAARLTRSERERLANMEGVVSVFPNKNYKLQTTTSWDFMGLKEGKRTKRNPTVESDVIIGVIDSGITPEAESFSVKGFGPPPKKWKGVCAGGKTSLATSNKLIGARDYTNPAHGAVDARDIIGHGTHTASTAAGNAVADISFFGIVNGTVRGGVPASRIAAYSVCKFGVFCSADDVLAAFDDAIADGVDLITISMGGYRAQKFENEPLTIGAFHAMAKGILTVIAASNSGPTAGLVSGAAPWLLTIAASTTNSGIVTKVVLGDGKTLVGKSVNTFDLKGKKYPLVYGKSASFSTCEEESARECAKGCLDPSLVKGKIVLCRSKVISLDALNGAVAAILLSPGNYASLNPLPSSSLSRDDFDSLVSYFNSTKSPQATVLKSEAIFNQTAPEIASFSSRGPNTIAVDILKPDITAPGVEILAAYSPVASPSQVMPDPRRVKYSVLSGTSMACPHVAGVAAYVKTFNPKWSPSMINSAIMTTAWPMNGTGTDFASTEFAYGAGHVDPIAALNPGLVYELDKSDHIAFLCGMNYNATTLKLITGEDVTCTRKTLQRNLNYPSMSTKLSGSNSSFTVTFNRTVPNVGAPNSPYKSKVLVGHGSKLSVKVSPSVLSMKSSNKVSFTVTVSGRNLDSKLPSSAYLIWSDGTHNVRSPIVVYTGDY